MKFSKLLIDHNVKFESTSPKIIKYNHINIWNK